MADSRPFDTLVLCATPRSGSTLLCSLLASSGVAGRPDSWFRQEDRAALAEEWALERDHAGKWSPLEYLDAARAAGQTPNGVFGLRLMWPTLGQLVAEWAPHHPALSEAALLNRLFGRCRFVFLSRADSVAQAVSRLKAEQSGHWHTVGDWVEQKQPAPGGVHYDPRKIAAYKHEAEAQNAAWTDWFDRHAVPVIGVDYADLATDPSGTVRKLLLELGLPSPPRDSFLVENIRLSDKVNSDWIRRFRKEQARGPG